MLDAELRRRAGVLAILPGLLIALGRSGDGPPTGPPRAPCQHAVLLDVDGLRCGPEHDPRPRASAKAALWMGRRFDLNRASAKTLQLVPGIGARLSRRIVLDRRRNGPFERMADVRRVKGIGPALLGRLENFATLRPPRTTSSAPNPSPYP